MPGLNQAGGGQAVLTAAGDDRAERPIDVQSPRRLAMSLAIPQLDQGGGRDGHFTAFGRGDGSQRLLRVPCRVTRVSDRDQRGGDQHQFAPVGARDGGQRIGDRTGAVA